MIRTVNTLRVCCWPPREPVRAWNGIYYRVSPTNRISYIGNSNKKKESLLLAMKLHIAYLRSLEDSERVRNACLTYLQNWFVNFYPERPDLVADLQLLAAQLQGRLQVPHLRWKYAWMKPIFGWQTAKWAQRSLPQLRAFCIRRCDRAMFQMEGVFSSISAQARAALTN